MRVVSAVVFVALVLLAASVVYWQHRLAPLFDEPSVALTPVPFVPGNLVATRRVDLGYVQFDLPRDMAGDLIQRGSSLFVELTDDSTERATLTICPPMSDREPAVAQALANFSAATGERATGLWQLRRRALEARPFSFWSAPFRNARRRNTALTLLRLKNVQAGGARQISLFENERIGVTVTNRAEFTYVEIADKHAGTSQLFIVAGSSPRVRSFVSCLVRSYHITATDFDPEALAAELKRIGIPRLASASAQTEPTTIALREEQARLRATLETLESRDERDERSSRRRSP